MSVVTDIVKRLAYVNGLLIKTTTELSDEQLRGALSTRSPSIGFHLWHCARWTDRLQSRLPVMLATLPARVGSRGEIWETEGIAARWHLDPDRLGRYASGMGMDDDVSAELPLPPKEDLLSYAARAFAAAERVVSEVTDAELGLEGPDLYDRTNTVATALLMHLGHVNRHLGMIEALRGTGGLKGSATV